MKAHTTSAISSLILIAMSAWGYLASETPSFTALIPLIFGLVILALYKGVKDENKVIAHVKVDNRHTWDPRSEVRWYVGPV